ncbi:hypothetical protein [Nostoc sp. UHCC 0251]|uniref:hypothetical protein n=1 Tax=Nostoc sp. UHCC 0251 TaxID=3110240 RepID=UPI002B2182E3|nr:hypothetical protein [Nostoc sp. UHCC 0251]MEA5623492.1 hypothetical protein [Nostoc sp. UHCC 0251]
MEFTEVASISANPSIEASTDNFLMQQSVRQNFTIIRAIVLKWIFYSGSPVNKKGVGGRG